MKGVKGRKRLCPVTGLQDRGQGGRERELGPLGQIVIGNRDRLHETLRTAVVLPPTPFLEVVQLHDYNQEGVALLFE